FTLVAGAGFEPATASQMCFLASFFLAKKVSLYKQFATLPKNPASLGIFGGPNPKVALQTKKTPHQG
ncbi:MAG: hypothetical protein J6A98_00055, partial [Clostridia bacterium]|nr:hypothetical protein [Clostridia bacterium]